MGSIYEVGGGGAEGGQYKKPKPRVDKYELNLHFIFTCPLLEGQINIK